MRGFEALGERTVGVEATVAARAEGTAVEKASARAVDSRVAAEG